MPMSCCHYSFLCNYRTRNDEKELDNENNHRLLENLNGKEERSLKIRK